MVGRQARKLLSGGEWCTLLGMVLCVMGAALTWERSAPQTLGPVVGAMAVYISRKSRDVPGYDIHLGWMSVGWVVVLCASAAASLLLFEPQRGRKSWYLGGQLAMAGIIGILALLYIGPYAGVIMALLGASLISIGAILRYR